MDGLPSRRASDAFVLSPGAFRLVLAAAVVLSHLSTLDIGRLAVLLFFYLSGYWTNRIWAEKFESRAITRFYGARYLRIAPLYLIVAVGAAVARHIPLQPENLMLFGVASTLHDPTHVAWSLDIELQFYLLLPFIAAFLAVSRAAVAIVGAVLMCAAGFWLRHVTGVASVIMYMPAFVLGALTFSKAWRPSARSAALGAAGFAALTLATAFTPFISKNAVDPFDRDVYATLWMLPLLPYVARSLTQRSSPLDRHLGNLSYPLYLVHFPLISLLSIHLGPSVGARLAIAALAAVTSVAIYVVVDRPLDRWRVRLTETPRAKTPAPTPLFAGQNVQEPPRA